MKRYVFGIISIAVLSISYVTARGQETWLRTIGGTKDENCGSVCSAPDGGMIVVGNTRSSDGDIGRANMGQSDMYVVKLDVRGNIMWKTTIGGEDDDFLQAVTTATDGGCLLTGTTGSQGGDFTGLNIGSLDIPIIRLDKDGGILWKKMIGGSRTDAAVAAIALQDGGFVIAGHSSSNDKDFEGFNHGASDIICMKIDADGAIVWKNNYGGSDADVCSAIVPTADGGFLITGYTSSNDQDVSGVNKGLQDVIVVKIDSTGEGQWTKVYGGSLNDVARSSITAADGNVVITGYTFSNDGNVQGMNKGARDIFVMKMDPQSPGNEPLWIVTIGGTAQESAASITAIEDGGIVITGITLSNDGDFAGMHKQSSDVVVVKLDAQGKLEWKKTIGGSRQDSGIMTTSLANKGVVVVGNTNSNDFDFASRAKNDMDIFVMKLDSDGNYDQSTSVDKETSTSAHLLVTPSALSTSSTITYTLEAPSLIRIELMNSLGQVVDVVFEGYKESGTQRLPLNASALTSGLYSVRMITEAGVSTAQACVVR